MGVSAANAGYGDGYGDGSGYGDGDGYGSGDDPYKQALLQMHAKPLDDRVKLAFWRAQADGRPANGGSGPVRKVGMVEEITGPLQICTKNALHGTLDPQKWKGDRLFVVALYPPIKEQDDKLASLKREILAEIVPNPWKE